MTEEKKEKTKKAEAEVLPLVEKNEAEALPNDKIGGILKQARLSQGKKIPEVSQILCIRKAYLEAIENNDYANIPEFPYGIGFIRSYADFLGLDSSLIIQKYKEETEAAHPSDNQYYVPEPQAEASVPSKKYLVISLLAIIAVYFAWYFFNASQNEEAAPVAEKSIEAVEENSADINQYPLIVEDYAPVVDAEADKTADENLKVIETAPLEETANAQVSVNEGSFPLPAAPATETKASPETAVPAASVETKPAVSGKSNVVLKIKKETWIEVKNADKLFISKVLQAGDSYAIPKGNGMILSIGRQDGVEVQVDGKAVNILPSDRKTNISLDEALNKLNH